MKIKPYNHKFSLRIYKDPKTIEAGVLAGNGFSNKLIQNNTSLTISQISYRLKQLGIKRKAYRDGLSPIARYVVKKSRQYTLNYVNKKIYQIERQFSGKVLDT